MRDQGYMLNVTPFISHEYQKGVWLYPERHDTMTPPPMKQLYCPGAGYFPVSPASQDEKATRDHDAQLLCPAGRSFLSYVSSHLVLCEPEPYGSFAEAHGKPQSG